MRTEKIHYSFEVMTGRKRRANGETQCITMRENVPFEFDDES